MTVVKADGYYVTPAVVKNLFIYSGETYSVLVTANQDPNRNYWLASNVVSRKPGTPTGTAILSYYGGRSSPRARPPTPPPAGPAWNDTAYRVRQSLATVAHPAHVVAPPPFPATPYLVSMKHGLHSKFDQSPPPDSYDHKNVNISSPPPTNGTVTVSRAVYRLALGSVVDLVLQNTNPPNNRSKTHPWHLHGHDFWVLGYRDGKFEPETDGWWLNLRDPVMKNTVALHPMGWTAVRFRADNPGVWLFHCHLEGMGVVFEESVERVARLPAAIMGCGLTKGYHY
ncbi:hypothetical protein E2562_028512 [Oryza meyeriana var. granulata]|uniref:Plastocyanin-like domain-containing protein n=1 Tax=Oryza meyeriana var. granulata TaxID=110450 RepID=A0A6G1DP78_9ORYZ|nr:hypothetical protein E2562_028512 [Oryza meyeriana var. granulata]